MTKSAAATELSKADQILQAGQQLIQTRGYDGFSYRDIADQVGIKSASVHYHFPAKTDLALAVVQQYRTTFRTALEDLDTEHPDPVDRLVGFAGIFQDTLENLDRVCVGAMLASEANSISEPVSVEAREFFAELQEWIRATIADGIEHGTIVSTAQPAKFARTLLSALEGAMIMARLMEQPDHLADVADQLISLLKA